jgi:hypothetical protein
MELVRCQASESIAYCCCTLTWLIMAGVCERVEMVLFPVLVEVSQRRAFAKVYLTSYRSVTGL